MNAGALAGFVPKCPFGLFLLQIHCRLRQYAFMLLGATKLITLRYKNIIVRYVFCVISARFIKLAARFNLKTDAENRSLLTSRSFIIALF